MLTQHSAGCQDRVGCFPEPAWYTRMQVLRTDALPARPVREPLLPSFFGLLCMRPLTLLPVHDLLPGLPDSEPAWHTHMQASRTDALPARPVREPRARS